MFYKTYAARTFLPNQEVDLKNETLLKVDKGLKSIK